MKDCEGGRHNRFGDQLNGTFTTDKDMMEVTSYIHSDSEQNNKQDFSNGTLH